MTEQIGITPIAVTKSKHSQKETLKLTMYAEFYLSPVELAVLSRDIVLPDKSLFPFTGLLSINPRDILACARIADSESS